jgi:hypothetical protein
MHVGRAAAADADELPSLSTCFVQLDTGLLAIRVVEAEIVPSSPGILRASERDDNWELTPPTTHPARNKKAAVAPVLDVFRTL